MRYRSERSRTKRRGNGCLAGLVILVWTLLLLLLGYRYFFREQVSQYIGQQISSKIGQQIEQAGQGGLPTVIAALPSGELRITEAQANEYLAAHANALRPIDSFTVRFVPGEIQTDIQAMGLTSSARIGVAVQNGRVIAVEPRLEGPLEQAISLGDLLRALEQQLNEQLIAQGRRATDVRVEQGAIIVTIQTQT